MGFCLLQITLESTSKLLFNREEFLEPSMHRGLSRKYTKSRHIAFPVENSTAQGNSNNQVLEIHSLE